MWQKLLQDWKVLKWLFRHISQADLGRICHRNQGQKLQQGTFLDLLGEDDAWFYLEEDKGREVLDLGHNLPRWAAIKTQIHYRVRTWWRIDQISLAPHSGPVLRDRPIYFFWRRKDRGIWRW